MAGQLTTHGLDTEAGTGAAGLRVSVRRIAPDASELHETALDERGRAVLLNELAVGQYELTFHVAEYHRARGIELTQPPFLDQVLIRFGVADPVSHYHVPLLLTRYSYSTYRSG